MEIVLYPTEITELFKQDPFSEADGGFQKLLVKLQGQFNRDNNTLNLDDNDLTTTSP